MATLKNECLGGCPKALEVKVTFTPSAWMKILSLLHFSNATEWVAYMECEQGCGMLEVRDILIPKQTRDGGECEQREKLTPYVIHSHHNMGSFFSMTDVEQSISEHELSIVINNDGEMKAVLCGELPCGSFGYREITDIETPLLPICEALENKTITKTKPKAKWGEVMGSWYGYGYEDQYDNIPKPKAKKRKRKGKKKRKGKDDYGAYLRKKLGEMQWKI